MAPSLPDSLTEEWLRRASVFLCGILGFLALMIIIPLGLSSGEAGGQCLLYASPGGMGPRSVCDYIYAVAAVFHLCCCLPRAAVLLLAILDKIDREDLLSSPYVLLGWAGVDVLGCLMTLVSGGLISRGFSTMCSQVFYPHSEQCGSIPFFDATSSSLVKLYYTRLNIAQGSIWFSWVVWVVLVVVDVLVIVRMDVLADLPCSGLQGPASVSDASNNAPAPRTAISRDRDTNHSQRSGFALLFKNRGAGGGGGGDHSDTDSGPRTPPPRRPVPPRPTAAQGGASVRPLMEKY